MTAIGPGFHPDTPGDGYDALTPSVTPERYDAIVSAARHAGVDVYGVAYRIVIVINL